MPTDIIAHLPLISIVPVLLGLTGLAAFGLVWIVGLGVRRYMLWRNRVTYARLRAQDELHQNLRGDVYARLYGQHSRSTDRRPS